MAKQEWNVGDAVFYKVGYHWRRGYVEKVEARTSLGGRKPSEYVKVQDHAGECDDAGWCYHPSKLNRRDLVRPASDLEIIAITEQRDKVQQRRDDMKATMIAEYASELAEAATNAYENQEAVVPAVIEKLKELMPPLKLDWSSVNTRIDAEDA